MGAAEEAVKTSPALYRNLEPGPERDNAVRTLMEQHAGPARVAQALGINPGIARQIMSRIRNADAGKPDASAMKPRRCLHCGQMRMSTGPGDRLHRACRAAVNSATP